MRLRAKLTLFFAAVLAAVLLLFAGTVYATYADYRRDEYYKRLHQQALTKVRLLLNAQVKPATLSLIYKNAPNALFQEEVAVYDAHYHLLYHDDLATDFVKETSQMLGRIARRGEITFQQQDQQKQYRCNGARLLTGYNSGCWSSAPDPVDFHSFQRVNLCAQQNLFYGKDSTLNQVGTMAGFIPWFSMRSTYRLERVIYRGEQMHSFNTVFNPPGRAGQP